MRVVSIELERFRGILGGRLDELADVNVLVGRNNAGKTSVVEALSRAYMVISQQFNDPTGFPNLEVWKEARGESRDDWPQSLVNTTQQDLGASVKIGFDSKEVVTLLLHTGPTIVKADNTVELQRELGRHGIYRSRDAFDTRFETSLWETLLQSRQDRRLVASLNEIYGLKSEGVQLLPSGKLMLTFEHTSVPLDLQGDGVRSAMRCLMLLAALKRSIMIVEEPECHQHPEALSHFMRALIRDAARGDVQLFVTTQSRDCVRSILDSCDASTRPAEGGHGAAMVASVFHLQLHEGLLRVRRLDAKTVRDLEDMGTDVRSLDVYG